MPTPCQETMDVRRGNGPRPDGKETEMVAYTAKTWTVRQHVINPYDDPENAGNGYFLTIRAPDDVQVWCKFCPCGAFTDVTLLDGGHVVEFTCLACEQNQTFRP